MVILLSSVYAINALADGDLRENEIALTAGITRIYDPSTKVRSAAMEIGVEQNLVKDTLEVEYGLSKSNNAQDQSVGVDLALKVPFTLSEHSEVEFGIGFSHTQNKFIDFSNRSVVGEYLHWLSDDYGYYIQMDKGVTVDLSYEVGVGLLFKID
jgi:hypothetical protein